MTGWLFNARQTMVRPLRRALRLLANIQAVSGLGSRDAALAGHATARRAASVGVESAQALALALVARAAFDQAACRVGVVLQGPERTRDDGAVGEIAEQAIDAVLIEPEVLVDRVAAVVAGQSV